MSPTRQLRRGILGVFLALNTFLSAADIPGWTTSGERPVDLVEPLVDSANSRWFFFNSASRPFGMVNLSPDMVTNGAWNSGYRYNEDRIRAFSHIHAWQLSGIPVFPTNGDFKGHEGSDVYGSRYSHEQELAAVGYHRVFLEDYGIKVELASTKRVGLHRYTFPESEKSQVLFDFSTFLGPCDTERASVRKVSDTEIEGFAVMGATRRRPKPVQVYFVAQTDTPFGALKGWSHGETVGPVDALEGERIGVYFEFPTDPAEIRMMKVAISYVSVAQARLNLEAELRHWNFEKVVRDSRREWNSMLGRIEVAGGTLEDRRRFYTDLWHALLGRRVISDVDGHYCDRTGDQPRVRQVPLDESGRPRFSIYNSDSFWGAQWTLNTLWQLVYPEIAEEFVNSLVTMYKDGGYIPRGPSGGDYTFVMTGASSTPFIVAAYMKGLRTFDVEAAYEGLRKNHMPGGLMGKAGYEHDTSLGGGIEAYIDHGYVPYPVVEEQHGFHQDGAGQTLEYAYQDWALAQFAKILGHEEDYGYFSQRAENYRNLWNKELGWMWVRDPEGQWTKPRDILRYQNGWVESNAAQMTWFVPHDLAGLAELMGGRQTMVQKLNSSFEAAKYHGFVSSRSHDQETLQHNRRVYLNYGNQPSMQTAMIFNHIGAPWLTQYWSRQVSDSVHGGLSPHFGYSGDEDQGLMGSLAVLMKIGLFAMNGGAEADPVYEFTTPLFDRVTLHLNPEYFAGESFVIDTEHNLQSSIYIQSATLNGEPWKQPWIYHHDLVRGGELHLVLGNMPNKEWGADRAVAPPSMSSAPGRSTFNKQVK